MQPSGHPYQRLLPHCVEKEGPANPLASCIVKAQNWHGCNKLRKVQKARNIIYDLIIANHPQDCTSASAIRTRAQELVTRWALPNPDTQKVAREQIDISPHHKRPSSASSPPRVRPAPDSGSRRHRQQNRLLNTTTLPMDFLWKGRLRMCASAPPSAPPGAIVETDAISKSGRHLTIRINALPFRWPPVRAL